MLTRGAGDNLVCVHMINASSLALRTYDVSYDRSPTIVIRMLEISRLFLCARSFALAPMLSTMKFEFPDDVI